MVKMEKLELKRIEILKSKQEPTIQNEYTKWILEKIGCLKRMVDEKTWLMKWTRYDREKAERVFDETWLDIKHKTTKETRQDLEKIEAMRRKELEDVIFFLVTVKEDDAKDLEKVD
jgi:hypothetical protein